MLGLDFSYFDLEVLRKFVLGGLLFSLQLTVVATVGGVLFGTLLALMRLSGAKLLTIPATFYVNGMRSVPLVMVILWFYLLMPSAFFELIPGGANNRSEISAMITFIAFACYLAVAILLTVYVNR